MISCEANKIQITDKSYPEIFDCEKQNTIKKCYTCGIKNYGLHINSNFELLPCQRTQIKECNYRIVDLGIKKKYFIRINPIQKPSSEWDLFVYYSLVTGICISVSHSSSESLFQMPLM